MTTAAVVTAAGYGTRLGSESPKALVPVAGRPLVLWAVEAMARVCDVIVVTAPPTHLEQVETALAPMRVTPDLPAPVVRVVVGGAERQQSVAAGLAVVADAVDADRLNSTIVLVHDAARAFQPVAVARAAIAAVEAGAVGAIPVMPVIDTLVAVSGQAEPGASTLIGDVVDRARLRAVQTPQTFRADVLLEAHRELAGSSATDDAQLVRALGHEVVMVDGDAAGLKVTTPADLVLAERAAASLTEPGLTEHRGDQ